MWEHFPSTPFWIYLGTAGPFAPSLPLGPTREKRKKKKKKKRTSAPLTFYTNASAWLTSPFWNKAKRKPCDCWFVFDVLDLSLRSFHQSEPVWVADSRPGLYISVCDPPPLDVNVDVLAVKSAGYICTVFQGGFFFFSMQTFCDLWLLINMAFCCRESKHPRGLVECVSLVCTS